MNSVRPGKTFYKALQQQHRPGHEALDPTTKSFRYVQDKREAAQTIKLRSAKLALQPDRKIRKPKQNEMAKGT